MIVDIVQGHASPNVEDGINKFDGSDDLYFAPGEAGNHSQWGSKCFDYRKREVFIDSNGMSCRSFNSSWASYCISWRPITLMGSDSMQSPRSSTTTMRLHADLPATTRSTLGFIAM